MAERGLQLMTYDGTLAMGRLALEPFFRGIF